MQKRLNLLVLKKKFANQWKVDYLDKIVGNKNDEILSIFWRKRKLTMSNLCALLNRSANSNFFMSSSW